MDTIHTITMEDVPPDHGEFWGIGVYENKLKTKINREKESRAKVILNGIL